uniref:Alpha beta-hydrolases superfamily protein n=1 Tax=Tetraselmis sp. GSL018 TaxID=582737 RepID=A0A061QP76_9CHLO
MGASDAAPQIAACVTASAVAVWFGLGTPGLRFLSKRREEARSARCRKVLLDAVSRGRERSSPSVESEVSTGSNSQQLGASQKGGSGFFDEMAKTLQKSFSFPEGYLDPENVGYEMEKAVIESEEGSKQGRVPAVIFSKASKRRKPSPAVIVIHATGKSKTSVYTHLRRFADMGFVAVGIDCRYHGERAFGEKPKQAYADALVRAWRGSGERPFLLDNVWDVMHVVDYLSQRADVDADRIGHIPEVFREAAKDLGKEELDAEVVRSVWDKIAPGLVDKFDSPRSLPAIAPRPLLVLNGEEDPRCPVKSLLQAADAARHSYQVLGSPDKFEVYVQDGCGHQATDEMHRAALEFFVQHLRPSDTNGVAA